MVVDLDSVAPLTVATVHVYTPSCCFCCSGVKCRRCLEVETVMSLEALLALRMLPLLDHWNTMSSVSFAPLKEHSRVKFSPAAFTPDWMTVTVAINHNCNCY